MYWRWPDDLGDCQEKHDPAYWDAFKIPQALLKASHAPQRSALLTLPNELLLQIFAHVSSVDQLFLALTCKRLLEVSSMTTMIIPSAPHHRADPSLNCSAMLGLLHVMQPLDAGGRPKKSWAPCCDCYRYRPKRKSYWKGVEKRYHAESDYRILEGYDSIVQSWSHKWSSSYQCPECWCEERIREYAHLIEKGSEVYK